MRAVQVTFKLLERAEEDSAQALSLVPSDHAKFAPEFIEQLAWQVGTNEADGHLYVKAGTCQLRDPNCSTDFRALHFPAAGDLLCVELDTNTGALTMTRNGDEVRAASMTCPCYPSAPVGAC